ncbi:unnamed protein product [Blepharisma stoltei]|uniref:Maleylacetoacetate isomerase n=1 Tax=Blepharisma stoltei TaxID=1481888 RepID=A0AAU9ICH9_9CILI|nr:unnamed protein product [Blepharisma stoltei]
MSSNMDYTLFSYWRSSCSWRVRIVLSIKNIPHHYHAINLLSGEQKGDEFIEKNPLKQVPYLHGEGVGISQSLAIIHYLEDIQPTPSVLPSTPILRAKMWEICEIINSWIQPLQNLTIINRIEALGGNKTEWAAEVITDGLRAVERVLEQVAGTYCVGDQLTIADACLVPQVYNARRFNVDLTPFPIVSRVTEALLALPEIQRAAPENQPDAVKA